MSRAALVTRLGRLAGLTAVAATAVAWPARAELIYSQRIERFEIGVRDESPATIWAALNRYGPLVDGRAAIGAASAQLRWSDVRIERSPQGCRVPGAKVHVSVTLTLPDWERKRQASLAMQQYWASVEDTVTVHEQRHATIWRETGEKIDRGLRALSVWMPCEDFEQRIADATEAVYRDGRRRQRSFDEDDRRQRRYQMCSAPQPHRTAMDDHTSPPRPEPAPSPSAPAQIATGQKPDPISNLALAGLAFLAAIAAYVGVMAVALRLGVDEDDAVFGSGPASRDELGPR